MSIQFRPLKVVKLLAGCQPEPMISGPLQAGFLLDCYFEKQMGVSSTQSLRFSFWTTGCVSKGHPKFAKGLPSKNASRSPWSPDLQEGGWLMMVTYAPNVEDRDVGRKGGNRFGSSPWSPSNWCQLLPFLFWLGGKPPIDYRKKRHQLILASLLEDLA